MSVTKGLLHELFYYEDGNLRRKIKTNRNNCVGDIIGHTNPKGYIVGSINRKKYGLHVLIWIYFNGDIPDKIQVDHIDLNPSNNKIENLRLLSHKQNRIACVVKSRANNTTGYRGVSKKGKKFRAYITVDGIQKRLGVFPTPEEAFMKRVEAEELYGFQQLFNKVN